MSHIRYNGPQRVKPKCVKKRFSANRYFPLVECVLVTTIVGHAMSAVFVTHAATRLTFEG